MYEYKGPINFWYDLFPSIVVILICCGFLCCPFLFLGCKDKAEARAKSVGITFTDCNFVTTEPNEPECKHEEISFVEFIQYFCSCGKVFNTWDILMKNIPTWPEYIELEKDLVFDNRGEIRWYNDYRVIEKGTKIYFKD